MTSKPIASKLVKVITLGAFFAFFLFGFSDCAASAQNGKMASML